MDNQEKQFVLYDYLRFFYKKKLYFIILPLIGLVIGAALTLFEDRLYEGEGAVFIGSVDNQQFSDPGLIGLNEEYLELVPEGTKSSVSVPRSNVISFKLRGEDQEIITNGLEELTAKFEEDLMNIYNERFAITERTVELTEDLIESTVNSVTLYEDRLDNEDISTEMRDIYLELLYKNENDLNNYLLRVERMQTDLLFFEKPEKLTISVKKEPSYLVSNMLVGLGVGLFLTLIMLVLWKYIFEARRSGYHD